MLVIRKNKNSILNLPEANTYSSYTLDALIDKLYITIDECLYYHRLTLDEGEQQQDNAQQQQTSQYAQAANNSGAKEIGNYNVTSKQEMNKHFNKEKIAAKLNFKDVWEKIKKFFLSIVMLLRKKFTDYDKRMDSIIARVNNNIKNNVSDYNNAKRYIKNDIAKINNLAKIVEQDAKDLQEGGLTYNLLMTKLAAGAMKGNDSTINMYISNYDKLTLAIGNSDSKLQGNKEQGYDNQMRGVGSETFVLGIQAMVQQHKGASDYYGEIYAAIEKLAQSIMAVNAENIAKAGKAKAKEFGEAVGEGINNNNVSPITPHTTEFFNTVKAIVTKYPLLKALNDEMQKGGNAPKPPEGVQDSVCLILDGIATFIPSNDKTKELQKYAQIDENSKAKEDNRSANTVTDETAMADIAGFTTGLKGSDLACQGFRIRVGTPAGFQVASIGSNTTTSGDASGNASTGHLDNTSTQQAQQAIQNNGNMSNQQTQNNS